MEHMNGNSNVTARKETVETKQETEQITKLEPVVERTEELLDVKAESKSLTLMQRLKSPGCWALGIFLLSTTLGISILTHLPTPATFTQLDQKVSTGDESSSSHLTEVARCFANAGIDALDSQPQVLCEDPVPCPPHGRCAMGQLVDCKLNANANTSSVTTTSEEPFFTPSSNGNSCVLSKVGVQDLLKVHQTLIDLTCETTCAGYLGLWTSCQLPSSQIYKGDESDIQFDLVGVASLLDMGVEHVLTLVEHMEDGSNIVVKELPVMEGGEDGSDGIYSIGLTPEFVQLELPVSFPCWARIVLWDLFQSIVYLMIGTI
jgi:hypothetical protein